jgi:hypothetical protein
MSPEYLISNIIHISIDSLKYVPFYVPFYSLHQQRNPIREILWGSVVTKIFSGKELDIQFNIEGRVSRAGF